MVEIWKDIEGYENYQVSNMGRIRSLNYRHTKRAEILKPEKDKGGYLLVALCKDGKRKTCLVHRLVAEAFIPNPDNLPQVNHKNEDKTDNRAECLEWCDNKYNNNYGTVKQRRAEKLSKPVLRFDKQGNFIKEYPSVNEVERKTGFLNQNVSNCCLGKRKTCGGYIWKYKEVA